MNKNRGEARLVYQSSVQTPRDVSFFCGRNRVCVVYTYIYKYKTCVVEEMQAHGTLKSFHGDDKV